VSAATFLLLFSAVLVLLPIISLVYELTHVDEWLRRAASNTPASADDVNTQRTAVQIASGIAIGLLVLAAVALFIPALFLRRGSRAARVLACIAALGAAVCSCGVGGLAIVGSQIDNQGSRFEQEFTRISADNTPTAVAASSLPAVAVPVLALLAFILLLVPPSNRFFRGPEASAPSYAAGGEGYYAYPATWGYQQSSESGPAAARSESGPAAARSEPADGPEATSRWPEPRRNDPDADADDASAAETGEPGGWGGSRPRKDNDPWTGSKPWDDPPPRG
jgi:hypothetical protein